MDDELLVRRLTLDEALPELDDFLYKAFVSGKQEVRIVHGKGTGTLRQAVREQLGKHSLVKSFRPGGHGEGGNGVTVVKLV